MHLSKNIRYLRKAHNLSQDDLSEKMGYKSYTTIQKWESGVSEPPVGKLRKLAEIFHVSMNELTNVDLSEGEREGIKNIFPIQKKRFPLIGTIACGEPILADEHFDGYVEAGTDISADFCIRAKGDSMKNIRIEDGDIVFIREQPDVENGEVAAVLIGEEATLKRVNKNKHGFLFLMPENPNYEPIIVDLSDPCVEIRIIGKAVAFQSDIK